MKCRVDMVDKNNDQNQDDAECNDSFIDIRKGEKQPLHAESEGNEQGDIEQYAEKHVFLGLFDIVIDAAGQCP